MTIALIGIVDMITNNGDNMIIGFIFKMCMFDTLQGQPFDLIQYRHILALFTRARAMFNDRLPLPIPADPL